MSIDTEYTRVAHAWVRYPSWRIHCCSEIRTVSSSVRPLQGRRDYVADLIRGFHPRLFTHFPFGEWIACLRSVVDSTVSRLPQLMEFGCLRGRLGLDANSAVFRDRLQELPTGLCLRH